MIYKEKDLFDYLKRNFIPDLEQSGSSISRYDCSSTEYNLDIELKCRRKHYNDLLIEKGKYQALMKRSKELGTIPVYVNSTPDGVWAFYIQDIDFKWETKNLPKQTDFGKRHWIPKEISYLNIGTQGVDISLPLFGV